jgi:hypothetical protein
MAPIEVQVVIVKYQYIIQENQDVLTFLIEVQMEIVKNLPYYKIDNGNYYHYYYDYNDDNDIKIIKKIYRYDNTCQTQSDSTQLKGNLPPKNIVLLADFEPCKLKDERSTLSIPNNPYLKFVVMSIDKKGNNHKRVIIELDKLQNLNEDNGIYLVNFDSKMKGKNPVTEKNSTMKKINGLALYNISDKPIKFNTGNSLALTAVFKSKNTR